MKIREKEKKKEKKAIGGAKNKKTFVTRGRAKTPTTSGPLFIIKRIISKALRGD